MRRSSIACCSSTLAELTQLLPAGIDEMARVMGVVGEGAGEALNMEEIEDFKQLIGVEGEMKIDDFVATLVDM